jgi:epimerase transport system membrane fusion protein
MDNRNSQEMDLQLNDKPYRFLGWAVITVTFVFLLGWSGIAPLESAVVAGGRIHVASLNKTVQHLDGGLVAHIAVQDGEMVEQGQLLLDFDRKPLAIQLAKVTGQLIETEANLERLTSENSSDTELNFSQELTQRAEKAEQTSILTTQQRLFSSRRGALASEKTVLKQRLEKARGEIASNREIIKTLRHRLALLDKDLAGLRKLAAKKLASQAKLREVQRQRSEIHGDLLSRQAEVSRLEASSQEILSQITLTERDFQKEVVSTQRELEASRIDLESQHSALKDKLSRIELRAPVAGKIKGFNVVTTGAVIKAGEPIMEIVPHESSFTIHARVSPMDIDSLYPGLKAEVRIPAFDGSQYFPSLYSDLKDVSADVFAEERSEEVYYKATLAMDGGSMEVLRNQKLQLVSGMPVEVVIKTGERTLLDYLIKPLRDMAARAFNEA